MPVVIYNKNQEFDASWCDQLVSVMRPNILGNPFPVTRMLPRQEAIRAYKEWLVEQLQTDSMAWREIERLAKIHAAGGTIGLVCCCTPLPCHAEVVKAAIEDVVVEKLCSSER